MPFSAFFGAVVSGSGVSVRTPFGSHRLRFWRSVPGGAYQVRFSVSH